MVDFCIYEYFFLLYCFIFFYKDDFFVKYFDLFFFDWWEIVGEGFCFFVDVRFFMFIFDEGEVDFKVWGEYERKRKWRVDEKILGWFRDIIV